MNRQDAIELARRQLKDPMRWDYAIIAYRLCDFIEEDTDLWNLARLLGVGEYGCSKGDVEGLIELMEAQTEDFMNTLADSTEIK
jgi:hypothetical protein